MSSDEENDQSRSEQEESTDDESSSDELEDSDEGEGGGDEEFDPRENSKGKKRKAAEVGEHRRKRKRTQSPDNSDESEGFFKTGRDVRPRDGKKNSSDRAPDPKPVAQKSSAFKSRGGISTSGDGSDNVEAPTVREVCKFFQLKDVRIEFTEADYERLTDYELFQAHVRPLLVRGNPMVPVTRLLMLIAAKYREFKKRAPASAAVVQTESLQTSNQISDLDGGAGGAKSKLATAAPTASPGECQEGFQGGNGSGAFQVAQQELLPPSIRSLDPDGGAEGAKSKTATTAKALSVPPVASSSKSGRLGVGSDVKMPPLELEVGGRNKKESSVEESVETDRTNMPLREMMLATTLRVTRLENQTQGLASSAKLKNLEARVEAADSSVELKLRQIRQEVKKISNLAAVKSGHQHCGSLMITQSEPSNSPIAAVLNSFLDGIRKIASTSGLEIEAVRELTEVMAKLQSKSSCKI